METSLLTIGIHLTFKEINTPTQVAGIAVRLKGVLSETR
jgi:hypothetical protein